MSTKKTVDPNLPDWKANLNILDENTLSRGRYLLADMLGEDVETCWNCRLILTANQVLEQGLLVTCPRCGHGWVQPDAPAKTVPFNGGQYYETRSGLPENIGRDDFVVEFANRHADPIRWSDPIRFLGPDEPVEMIPLWASPDWIPAPGDVLSSGIPFRIRPAEGDGSQLLDSPRITGSGLVGHLVENSQHNDPIISPTISGEWLPGRPFYYVGSNWPRTATRAILEEEIDDDTETEDTQSPETTPKNNE
jgi:hypothetical protein